MRYFAIPVLFGGCQLVFTIPEPLPVDAGPDSAPVVIKHIFVTSERFDGNLGGIAGADEKCKNLADGAGLPGEYLAWISTVDSSPAARMAQHPGPYHAIGGTPIANGWIELTSGMLLNAVRTDERGSTLPVVQVCRGDEVWSNTRFDGTFESDSCSGWTDGVFGLVGGVGSTFYKDSRWTYDPDCPTSCEFALSIFCVEQ